MSLLFRFEKLYASSVDSNDVIDSLNSVHVILGTIDNTVLTQDDYQLYLSDENIYRTIILRVHSDTDLATITQGDGLISDNTELTITSSNTFTCTLSFSDIFTTNDEISGEFTRL